MRTLAPLAVVLALLPAGCGADDPVDTTKTTATTASSTSVAFLDAAGADRVLGNTFRAALARFAVMTQPGDDAADLGQTLPTGLVDSVRCRPDGARPATGVWNWSCRVRWASVDGDKRTTRYVAQLTDHGCLYANAQPRFRQIQDSTTHAPAEHPLSYLAGAIEGC